MARTKIAISDLTANAGTDTPAGTTIDAALVTAGAYVDLDECPPEELVLRITNTHGVAHIVTIPKGDNPPSTVAGAITKSVGATTGDVLIGPFTGAKIAQAGSAAEDSHTMHVDFVTDHAGKITALRVPRTA